MEPSDAGRRMGHEFIGVVEAVGEDVCTMKAGDVVVAPFVWSDGTHVSSAAKDCTHPASTGAGTALMASTAARAKLSVFRRPTEPSSPFRLAKTMH